MKDKLKYNKWSYYLFDRRKEQFTIVYGTIGSKMRVLAFVKDFKKNFIRYNPIKDLYSPYIDIY